MWQDHKRHSRRRDQHACKGRSIGKKVKEDRERKSSVYGQAIRSAARVKEEFSSRVEEESRGALWQGDAKRSIPTRVKMVHERSNSNVRAVRKVWREEVSCKGK